jgi:hypothetical protein
MARNLRQEEVAYNVGPVGPIKWMAPEALQMMSKKQKVATPQSDVYMFGITLWEMLAREHPHMTMDQNYVGNQVRLGGAYSYYSSSRYTAVQLYRCTVVQLYSCTGVQVLACASVGQRVLTRTSVQVYIIASGCNMREQGSN